MVVVFTCSITAYPYGHLGYHQGNPVIITCTYIGRVKSSREGRGGRGGVGGRVGVGWEGEGG